MQKETAASTAPCHRCFVGFDGYVDTVYRVVRSRRSGTMTEFGQRIVGAAGRNADIEIIPTGVTVGGNAPILANTLAGLGVETVLIGMLSVESGHDPFSSLHPLCHSVSVGRASRTSAMEFNDGKVMLGELHGNELTWEALKACAGTKVLEQEIAASELLCLVNWSGLIHMNAILRGLLTEYLVPLLERRGHKPQFFFDLADPSARSQEDLKEWIALMRQYAAFFPVTLGLNANEARNLGHLLHLSGDLAEIGWGLRQELCLEQLFIHTPHEAYGFRKEQMERQSTTYIQEPRRSTGAGDNFNAGFCLGLLEGRSLRDCLLLGRSAATIYVAEGVIPDRISLEKCIKERK